MENLKQIITEKVFDNKKIKEISSRSNINGKDTDWIMDFKSVSVDKFFLNDLCKVFSERYKNRIVQVCGMESGALPLITALCINSDEVCNSFYVRKARKKHDLSNIYEGDIHKGVPIILVDDILNKGSTMLKQVVILEELGYKVSEVFVVLRFRNLAFYKELNDRGIIINSIFELDDFKDALGIKNILEIRNEKSIPMDKYKNLWTLKLAEHKTSMYLVAPKSGLCEDGTYIYTGVDDGFFYCIDKKDGSIKWKFKICFGVPGKNIFSTPCLSSKYVFFGAYDGNLYCLDKETGKTNWIFFDADYIGASPWIENDEYVYIGLEFGLFRKKGGVAKVSIKTGKIVWANYEMFGLTHASPVSNIKLNVVVCGCNDNYIYCFDRKTGVLKWKYKTEGEVKYGSVFDEKRGLVIIAGMDKGVYCLNTKDGSLYYKFEGIFGFYSTPILHKDNIYIGGLDKRIYCFDLKNKSKKWEIVTKGRIFASPVMFEKFLYIGSNDGILYEIDTDKGELLSRTIISERIVNRIIVNKENGRRVLYIKSFTNELYKFLENK